MDLEVIIVLQKVNKQVKSKIRNKKKEQVKVVKQGRLLIPADILVDL